MLYKCTSPSYQSCREFMLVKISRGLKFREAIRQILIETKVSLKLTVYEDDLKTLTLILPTFHVLRLQARGSTPSLLFFKKQRNKQKTKNKMWLW